MSPARRIRIASLALSLSLALWGCGGLPQSASLSPEVRARLGAIGVVSARFPPKGDFEAYGRGGGAGAVRGAVEGIGPGAVGGLYAGLVCGPWAPICWIFTVPPGMLVGGFIGTVVGAHAAVSEEKAGQVDTALERTRAGLKIQEGMRDALVKIAREKASRRFLLLPGQGPAAPDKEADYRPLAGRGVDTILETSVQAIAMRDVILLGRFTEKSDRSGEGREDPRLRFLMTVRTRLVRVSDGGVLHVKAVEYKGSIRKFSDWVSKDAELMGKELESAYQVLAGQIVTDLFPANP